MNEEFRRAERQYGVTSRVQLRAEGLSDNQIDRRIASGRIERVFPGVYRVVGSVPGQRQLAMVATLWLTGGAISHVSAAALLRLDAVADADELHLTIAADSRRGRTNTRLVIHRSTIGAHHRRIVDGLACTSAARTLVDCAALVTEDDLEDALESARRMGLATATTVARALTESGRRAGATSMRRVLSTAEARPRESPLEVRLARLLRTSDLPASVLQYQLGSYRLDRAWPSRRVGVEADGFQHHGRRLQWKRDRARVAAIEAMGWRLVHVTWDDITKTPGQTLDRIRAALHTMAA